jgi:hypothetical protein
MVRFGEFHMCLLVADMRLGCTNRALRAIVFLLAPLGHPEEVVCRRADCGVVPLRVSVYRGSGAHSSADVFRFL